MFVSMCNFAAFIKNEYEYVNFLEQGVPRQPQVHLYLYSFCH